MNWYNRKLAQSNNYGYWLKPDGQLIIVTEQNHIAILRDKLDPEATLRLYELYEKAFNLGWIRMSIIENELNIQYNKNKGINSSQKNSLTRLFLEHYKENRYNFRAIIDYAGGNQYTTITNPTELNQFLDKV
jgi:hypothetical protein